MKRHKKHRENVQKAKKLRADIRHDFEKPSDPAWGTSPGKLGEVKRESEEARHVTCSECGYGGGRYSSFCSRITSA